MVFEAVQPVRITSLRAFINRTSDQNFAVTRLKNADEVWDEAAIECLEKSMSIHLGKDYDAFFNWGDDQLYCSELAWKVYQSCTGLEVGQLKPLKAYNLDHPEVKRVMNQRYGSDIPWDEPMIAPSAMFESPLFQVIYDTEC